MATHTPPHTEDLRLDVTAESPLFVLPDEGVEQYVPYPLPRSVVGKAVQNYIPDLLDHIDSEAAPVGASFEGESARGLRERLLPEEFIPFLRQLGQGKEPGLYRAIRQVGDAEDKTLHPHFFFVDTRKGGVTRLYYVDPEHKVARRKRSRPPIVNLMAVEVPHDSGASPKVAIVRYRTPQFEDADKAFLGMVHQQVLAQELVERPNRLPHDLQGVENQLLFYLYADDTSSGVQARYSSVDQIQRFSRGQRGSNALEGKVHAQLAILDNFLRQAAKFKRVRTG